MRIKKIEIIGFKSFCDRTVVDIDEPITAIVGPNGCGKSNIVDALRWCMGEQSAKHLRGGKMEDVIFAGSETRGPAGMAEVSLTFEHVGFGRGTSEAFVPARSDDEAELLADLNAAEAAAAAATDRAAAEPPAPVVRDESETAALLEAIVAEEAAAIVENVDLTAMETATATATDTETVTATATATDTDTDTVTDAATATDTDTVTATAIDPEVILETKPTIDFTQYGEVTITRRLFRDGTSEYFINKTPSRLRDITEFFLGTGVGTKAYSIIEQGRVGMIVSAKPEDRRLVIEEAAGITKFKKKKQAAERKMDQTRQNLLRVSDVVEEIDKRLGSLRRAAQKAERYKKYRAEVRDIELWSAAHRTLGSMAEEGVLLVTFAEKSETKEKLAAEVESKELELTAARAELTIEDRALGELTQQVFDLDNRVKLGESQVEFQSREAADLEQRVQSARGEIDALGTERELGERELEQVTLEAESLKAQAAERAESLSRLEEEQRMQRGRLDDAQAELDGARAELARAQADIARAEGNARGLERRKGELEGRRARLEEEDARAAEREQPLLAEVAGLDGKLEGLRQMKLDLASERESLEARQVELREQHGHLEAEVETLRTERHRRKSRLQSLQEIADRYEGFARGTRAVMQHRPGDASGEQIRGLLADVVEAPPECEAAVEALLGDRLGSILVESKDVGLAAVDFLKSRKEGRSTFIPVAGFGGSGGGGGGGMGVSGAMGGGIEVVDATGVRGPIANMVRVKDEYHGIAEHLFGDALLVESLPRALELLDAGLRRTMVTLEGDLVDPRGVVTGGSRDAAGAGVLQQKREIRELEGICEGLDRDLADATARHVACKAELTKVSAALESLRKHAHEGEITLLAHEKDLARFRAEADRLGERRGQLGRELEEGGEQLAACERELGETVAALDGARMRAGDAERTQLGLIEGVTMARGALEDATGQVTEAKILVAQAAAAEKSHAAQKARLEMHTAELARRVDKLTTFVDESSARAAELRDASTQLSMELVSLRADRIAASDELGQRKTAYDQRVNELGGAEVSLREIRHAADKLANECGKLELRLHDVRSQRQHLEEAIFEKHRVILKDELHAHHLRPPVGDAEEARLRELRDLIERMGEINLTAITEYEELSGRFEFLSTQKLDLERALEQLEAAIAKINKTSRKLFRETFDAVNAKFQEVFPRLFRGGQAYLRLTGGDEDLLDAGVEIFAQPPGKKNTTVELLSGGEKALTAVSMIFAIFLIKPSPFCVLDEVDAPLDEANVGRYNELVRSMTDRSQFIVITHNKRTMEIADELYGVTMQEAGVSKLVNVNLKQLPRAKAA